MWIHQTTELKYVKRKLTDATDKRIDKSLIIVGDFNTSLSAIDN